MTLQARQHDAIVLVHRRHVAWRVDGCQAPLFICAEMFLGLRDIESRRWQMWTLRANLVDAGLCVATLSDFLLSQDIDWLEAQSARVAHDWYLGGDGDATIYRGVSLGRCVEYEVKARAVRLLKLSRCIQRVLERHPDAKIYSDFADHSTEQRVLNQFRGATHQFGEREVDANTRPRRLDALRAAQSFVLARGRRWGLAVMKLLVRCVQYLPKSDSPLVVVRLGLQSLKMLESWTQSEHRPPVRFALWMDHLMRPREVLSLVMSGSLVVGRPQNVPVPSVHDGGYFLGQVGGALSSLDPRFHIESGPHLEIILSDLIRQVACSSFPAARSAVDDGYDLFDRMNAVLLVTPNDCQLATRAWTLVAKRLGKASLVFQHGHLDYTEDENHLTATHSAFWSTVVAHQFQATALQPEQTIVTGSPNADAFFTYVRQRPSEWVGAESEQGRPRILIVTTGNPGVQAYVSETWVCDYIAGVLDALAPRFADLSICVKLHPGEDSGLYKRHLGNRLPQDANISDRGDLASMIANADVVISPPSTVVLEARAGGSTVVLLPVPSVNDRKTTLEHVDGVITILRYEELPATIDNILAGKKPSHVGALPLSGFLGPLDGKSSHRLLEAVARLAHLPKHSRRNEAVVVIRESDVSH